MGKWEGGRRVKLCVFRHSFGSLHFTELVSSTCETMSLSEILLCKWTRVRKLCCSNYRCESVSSTYLMRIFETYLKKTMLIWRFHDPKRMEKFIRFASLLNSKMYNFFKYNGNEFPDFRPRWRRLYFLVWKNIALQYSIDCISGKSLKKDKFFLCCSWLQCYRLCVSVCLCVA
jgi:hypothetical protein